MGLHLRPVRHRNPGPATRPATVGQAPAGVANQRRTSHLPGMRRRSSKANDGPAAMNGQLLTAEQLADRWQVPKSQVYRLTRDQRIPAVRLGKYYRYRVDAIEAFETAAVDTVPEPKSGRGNRVNGPPA